MNEDGKPTPVQRLRAYVAELEQENNLLKGHQTPSEAIVDLRAENAELRRSVAAVIDKLPGAQGPNAREYLTVPQLARQLGLSIWRARRLLGRDIIPTTDAGGQEVVHRNEIERYLRARAEGRPTSRFL